MADDGDVPPLEDMSELLQQVHTIHEQQNALSKEQVTKTPVTVSEADKKECHTDKGGDSHSKTPKQTVSNAKTKASEQKDSGLFGGMKKGFLFGGGSKPSSAKTADKSPQSKPQRPAAAQSDADIPYIRPQADSGSASSLQFEEVQQSMSAPMQSMDTKAWVTDDLLNKVMTNPLLTESLQDPICLQALGDFQQDPKAAKEKYKENPKIHNFLREFCVLMGEHFDNLHTTGGDATQQSTSGKSPQISLHDSPGADISVYDPQAAEDQARIQSILADPETRAILEDSRVKELFEKLHQNPEEGARLLYEADPELRRKIHKLKEVGLLDIRSQ